MMDLLRKHVLAWTTSTALILTMLQLVTPSFIDWLFDFMVVGLVFISAKLAAPAPTKR